ncbi:MAG: hypothetical protein JSS99_06555 [Actinobacteria bacterium]|nr:hypothetical protein [Actinomycetota bacterium]
MRALAVALAAVAFPLAVTGCNGPGAKPTVQTLTFGATETIKLDTVQFGALEGITLRLGNAFPTRYEIVFPETTCEGATAPARQERGCTIKIRRLTGGNAWIAIKRASDERVLDNIYLR